jgi:hypothetical protein
MVAELFLAPVIFIFLSSNQAGSCCNNRRHYTIFSGKMTVKKGMVQFWVAASSAAPRLSLPKAWGWQNSQSGATIPIPRG